MKCAAVPVLLAWAGSGVAATAYVSDELVLGVYAGENGQGQRLATLHSGAHIETLSAGGEYTQVRLSDGTTGWVKTAYLTAREPASARVQQLEEQLARSRATTPALAEAAARSEVEQLKRELADKQSQLEAASAGGQVPAAGAVPGTAPQGLGPWGWVLAGLGVLALVGGGFWLGYATLARRVINKFGGVKVY